MAPDIKQPHKYKQKNNKDSIRRIKAIAPTLDGIMLTVQRRSTADEMECMEQQNDDQTTDSEANNRDRDIERGVIICTTDHVTKLRHTFSIDDL